MLFPNELENDLDSLKINCCVINDIEKCKDTFTPDHNFKVFTFNIRSIQKNFDTLLVALKRLDISYDVYILTECWLNEATLIPQLPGYNYFKTNNVSNQNGGVVVYVKDIWIASVSEPAVEDASCLIIYLHKLVTILAIYRSPSCRNIENFLSSLEPCVSDTDGLPVVLAGDVNVNILDTSSTQCLEYQCFMAEKGLIPAITEPTRGLSCLDHIYVSGSQLSRAPIGIVCQSDITDHYPVMIGMNLVKNYTTRLSRVVIKRDFDAIKNDLKEMDWSIVNENSDVNTATKIFSNLLTNIVVKHTCEVRLSRSKYNLKPWITPGLMRCMKHRDRLHQSAKLEPNNKILRVSYTRYQNFFVGLLRKLKLEYENKELSDNKNNPKKLWKSIKNVCNLANPRKEPTELLSLESSDCPRCPLDLCNDHFSTVGQRLANEILTKINLTQEELASSVKAKSSPSDSFFMSPTSHEEVEKLILGLKNDKAPGIDGLANSLIKHIKDAIVVPLTYLYNLSLASGKFPHDWKLACVSPIHKSGPRNCIENYRPISLLGTFSKLLEKLVNNRLISFLESRNILSPRQFGFRRGKSTEDAVSLLTSAVSSRLDSKQNCVGVFLDLAKAFDTVSVPILLNKINNMGIRGIASEWFKSYLSERRQCVRIGLTFSTSQTIDFGVPQGSILGPTLFTMYINDIHDLSSENAEIICYADDTAIVYHGSTWPEALSSAELGMTYVSGWLQQNLLTLNTKKTVYVCFHKTAASAPIQQTDIKIHDNVCTSKPCNCVSLNRVNVIKYLGIHIDENMTFKHHIIALSGRVRKIIGVVKSLRDVACMNTLKSIYFALCQSLITYCITCWGSAAKGLLIRVERAQRSVLKVMMNKPFRYPTTDVYKESGVLSVRQLFILKTSLSVHKSILTSAEYQAMIKRRVYRLPTPPVNTSFAFRFGQFVRAHVYNSVVKHCDLKEKSLYEAKNIINKWLSTLTYDGTEDVLHIKT